MVIKYPDGHEEVFRHLKDWVPQRDDIYSDGKGDWVVDRVKHYNKTSFDVWVVPLEE
jgi:hypothetical protein